MYGGPTWLRRQSSSVRSGTLMMSAISACVLKSGGAMPEVPMSMHIRCAGILRGDPYGTPREREVRDTNPAHGHAEGFLVPFLVPDPLRRVEGPLDEGGF